MSLNLSRVNYSELNARQKENFNFQKVSAVLADYGFVTLRPTDDYNGADFLAYHVDGQTVLKVQLKGRLGFHEKYLGKGLYITFFAGDEWFLYPHDELLDAVFERKNIASTKSWQEGREYTFPYLSVEMRALLSPYKINGNAEPIAEDSPNDENA